MSARHGSGHADSDASHEPSLVCVVDDDLSVREAVAALVGSAGWRAATFATAQAFLDAPAPSVPACAVLDLALPDLDGLELQQRLSGLGREMPIIFLTGRGDIPMTVRAMKAGALEFLTKPCDPSVLLDAIGRALERSRAARRQADDLRAIQERYDALTRREREVMSWVVAGLLNKQIGAEIGTSEITVKAHRGRVMQKMQAASLPDLVRMAGRLGVPLPRRR